ncbi:uncharacterized protein LOC105393942 isoform X2 [Plutella xylostella]|uniref:uncharacterized protein LOC105393942 isoform X2 n=1 Tax=Plutella xylostella TaxID=51655 RepID=UPI0020327875|nr:uncharacterized protein LOC105393942 isoform X2 [Plutella xylostella]
MESAYDSKFEEMKKYIPFLESMIRRLESTGSGAANPRQAQLSKIKALRDLLSDKSKRMKMENLLKCEQVLLNLYAKVEQRDTLPGIEKAPQSISPSRNKDPSANLDKARQKLKATSISQDNTDDTLPEIARANQSEVYCSPGSKEPALFQRRPHRAGSPGPPPDAHAPLSKRNYTRVLVSPPRNTTDRWSASRDRTPENQLFQRRSPKKTPKKTPPFHKKERKKRRDSDRSRKNSRSEKNLNITLKVPEESLDSLNTEDILDRIINCDNTDVDIGTLRELRSQILGELKQTGANEDISDLILKSYRNKGKKIKPKDVEEGELSDSESEAIEHIYGSLVVVDSDKKTKDDKLATSTSKASAKNTDSRKIQICLVISNNEGDKALASVPTETSANPPVSIVSDQSSEHFEEVFPKPGPPSSFESPFNTFNLSSDVPSKEEEIENKQKSPAKIASGNKSSTIVSNQSIVNIEPLDLNDQTKSNETVPSVLIDKVETIDKTETVKPVLIDKVETVKEDNRANFYKPIEQGDIEKPREKLSHITQDVKKPEEKPEETKVAESQESLPLAPEDYLKLTCESNDEDDKLQDSSFLTTDDNTTHIPFLSDPPPYKPPPVPRKENKESVSEIDILQALKKEILSETIPGAESVTPNLHQPKILTKVSNAQDIAAKKKISLENYKKKSVQKPKETQISITKDDSEKLSRALTAKEFERFNITGLAIDSDSSDDNKEDDNDVSLSDIYGDLDPRSPENEIITDDISESPVIIPDEPVKAPSVAPSDVDMRVVPNAPSHSIQNQKDLGNTIKKAEEVKPVEPRIDPRKRKDMNTLLNKEPMNSPQSISQVNPGGTPRPLMQNLPNMTPSRAPIMTPNSRAFEMTPTPQSFEVEEQTKKHVYAPLPSWERDGESSKDSNNSRWESHESRGGREGSARPRNRWNNERDDKFARQRDPRLNLDRPERLDCPSTPSHYFGRGDYPTTPSHPFGRSDGSMTPVHPFGRSDMGSSTPRHSFGGGDGPSTPVHPFGRGDMTPSHAFGRSDYPVTPSHPFGRSDCPATPSHPFGRSESLNAPNRPFDRSDCPPTPNHPFGRTGGYDSRNNRRGYDEDDRGYNYRDHKTSNYKRGGFYGNKSRRPYAAEDSQHRYSDAYDDRGDARSDNYSREYNAGRSDYNRYAQDPSVDQHYGNEGFRREASVGRTREHSVGRFRNYEEQHAYPDEYHHHRGRGRDSRRGHPHRDRREMGNMRERSVGRGMGDERNYRANSRARSVGRTYEEMPVKTVSVESHAGRSFTIDTSINSTFQAFKPDDSWNLFDARRKRASSVGRSITREGSVGRALLPNPVPAAHQNPFTIDRRSNFKRAQSVGRDVVQKGSERSFKDIKADFEAFKAREMKSKNVKIQPEPEPKKANETKNETIIIDQVPKPQRIMKNRDPRNRKTELEEKEKEMQAKKDAYSPRKNPRDPRFRRSNDSPTTKYTKNPSPKKDSKSSPRDKKHHGIVYTNDNIARGNILGPGAGVKNYKIPKIKRPPEEEKVPDEPQQPDIKETKVPTPSLNETNETKKVKEDKVAQADKAEIKMKKKGVNEISTTSNTDKVIKKKTIAKKTIEPERKIDEEDRVSPRRTRRAKKAVIYDTDSDDNTSETSSTITVGKNISDPKDTKSKDISDPKDGKTKNKVVETTDNQDSNSMDFSFDLPDAEIDLFTDNIASDTVIDNINDLIAGLDKDLHSTKESDLINSLSKNDVFDNLLNSLTDSDSTNLQIDSQESQDSTSKNSIEERNENEKVTEQTHTSDANQVEASVENVETGNAEHSKDEKESKNDMSDSISQAKVPDNIEVVSTSVPEEKDTQKIEENIELTPVLSSEACSTPDSTINTEENETESKLTQDIPDSTNTQQTEMNSDISSTHDTTEQPTTETSETKTESAATAASADSLGNILSILNNKSRIKELLSMLDNNADSEKLKKKLEKLSAIVSDDEDSEKEVEESSKVESEMEQQTNEDDNKKTNEDEPPVENEQKPSEADEEKAEKGKDEASVENANESKDSEETSQPLDKIENKDDEQEKTTAELDQSITDDDNESIASKTKSQVKKVTRKTKVVSKGKKITRKGQKRVTRSVASAAQKPKPTRKRGKRELEQLQEDIRDMFISNDVINATGIRMCRLAKLVEEKKNLSDTSPTKSIEDPAKDREPAGPVVVIEKKNLTSALANPSTYSGRKRGRKTNAERATLKNVSPEKPQPVQKNRPGPKSKTKQPPKHEIEDPYEFESDSLSERAPASENSPSNSESDSDSMDSSQSNSSDLLVELKTKSKRKRRSWQLGVIKSKRTKKKLSKTIDKEEVSEPVVSEIAKPAVLPDMNCFTDKTYCFIKTAKVYPCRLCHFEGEAIVSHYKKKHPHYEIPLSRMNPQIAKKAINQSMITNFSEIRTIPIYQYICRFCSKVLSDKRGPGPTDAKRKSVLESFFWHVVSTHTGEYKQQCSDCTSERRCTFMLDIPPPPRAPHGLLMGYICGKCNYTQVSLENLKNHVSLRHNDEETEVYTISLSVMTLAMLDKLKRSSESEPRTLRSLRSKNTVENEDQQEPAAAEVDEPEPEKEESDKEEPEKEEPEKEDPKKEEPVKVPPRRRKPGPRSVQSRINFESDNETLDTDTVVKSETDDNDDVPGDLDDSFDEHRDPTPPPPAAVEPPPPLVEEPVPALVATKPDTDPDLNDKDPEINVASDVYLLPHFKISYTDTGAKEYVCCINGEKHYTTSLLISMKRHIQLKHGKEFWDGYCSMCKVIILPQGCYSFKDCLTHMLDVHSDNFPTVEAAPVEKIEPQVPAASYINVRPISDLVQPDTPLDEELAMPKIACVMSLNSEATVQAKPPSIPTDVSRPTTSKPTEKVTTVIYEEHQMKIVSEKHRIILDLMMSSEKLAHVFKCGGRFCSFTSDSLEDALQHASAHQRLGGENALVCAYCSFDAGGNAIDLVSHVFKEHGSCVYCCKWCFYRGFSGPLVEAHCGRRHAGRGGAVLRARGAPACEGAENDGLMSRQEAVKHYVCSIDRICRFRTYTVKKFLEHYEQKHLDVTSHPCNECSFIGVNPASLVKHLESHGLRAYQCAYCAHGAAQEQDMLAHASQAHPDKVPRAYLRHIVETKEGATVSKFKVLPLVNITKKDAVRPYDVSAASKVEDPVKEAERALDLEKLIGRTSQSAHSEARAPDQPRDVPEETPEPIETTPVEETPVAKPIEPPKPATPPPEELPLTDRATPKLKTEVAEPATPPTTRKRAAEVVVLDSDDEEDSKKQTAEKPGKRSKDVDIGDVVQSSQRYTRANLYKCGKCSTILKTAKGLKRHYSFCYTISDMIQCAFCSYETPADLAAMMLNHYAERHGPEERHAAAAAPACQLFSVTPQPAPPPVQRAKRKRSSTEAPPPQAKLKRYDLTNLPHNQIFDETAQCALCEFTTKVRQNLVRHLQLHSQRRAVPDSAPVNPVPHLETNEMHFDRMVNLASSSVATRERAADPAVAVYVAPELAARYPRYVPERQRYACGAAGCSYISIDEAMLKCHWETLHAGSGTYHCVHCPASQQLDTSRPLTAPRILAHLHMHDVRLFGCTACPYYHHQQYLVDKHVREKHAGAGSLRVVRGPASTPPAPAPPAPTMDLKPWQCGLCQFKSMLRPEVVDHCSKTHQSKFQFKCAFCPWRTSTLENVTKHHNNSHAGQQGEVFYFYYREGSIPDEADGTPRWRRQRARAGLPSEPEVKADPEPTPAPAPPATPATPAVDLNIVKSEVEDPDELSIEALCAKFGAFCEPNGIRYKCCLCGACEDSRGAMTSHLYEELQYRKWGCRICSYKAFHKEGLQEHARSEHRSQAAPLELAADAGVERWARALLDRQEQVILQRRESFQKQHVQTPEQKQVQAPAPPPEEPKKMSMQELEQAFGPFGAPKQMMFACPKCDYQAKDEASMHEHLEMELNKVRWSCSLCPMKFQHYHEAQRHCGAHAGAAGGAGGAGAVREAPRAPGPRAAWLRAALQVQKLTMNVQPAPAPAPAAPAPPAPPPDNSLLVVRYEEDAERRADSDDERLVIDEPAPPAAPAAPPRPAGAFSCAYCSHSTNSRGGLADHVLRHYSLKPYRCGHCGLNAHLQTLARHHERDHPGLPRRVSRVPAPAAPPPAAAPPTAAPASPAAYCLICSRAVPQAECAAHACRADSQPQLVQPGQRALQCATCLIRRTSSAALRAHHAAAHAPAPPAQRALRCEQLPDQVLCRLRRCGKVFTTMAGYLAHHDDKHAPTPPGLERKPVLRLVPAPDDGDLTDEPAAAVKRGLEDAAEPPVKRVARKSTTRLPAQRVARKSTARLPWHAPAPGREAAGDYSYYGAAPAPLARYADVRTHLSLPGSATPLPVTVRALANILDICPRLVLKDANTDKQ